MQQSIPDRGENGQLLPGHTANPYGRNGHLKGWQRWGDRAQYLGAKYTPEQIIEYATDSAKRNKDLSYWDAVCVQQMARSLDRTLTLTESGTDQVSKERESLVDRIEGKSAQPFISTPDQPGGVNSEQKMLDMALKIAFILHQGVKVKGMTIDQPAKDLHDVEPDRQTTDRPPSGS